MASLQKLHAIIIPLPHPGHMNPAIDLALKLAMKGFSITYVYFEFVHHQIKLKSNTMEEVDIFYSARKSGLDIRYATIGDGFPLEFDRILRVEEYWESMLVNFPARVEELLGKIIQAVPSSVHFSVTDTFLALPATVAKKYNIVNVSFWTQPALVFSIVHHSELLREKGHCPCKDNIKEEIAYLPGIKSINTKDFMPYLRESAVGSIAHKIVCSVFKEVTEADFILHNTVYELESETFLDLNKYQSHYAIGPISFFKDLATNNVHKSICPETDCTGWLASKHPGSVLYVSFGSLVMTSRKNIEEIAYGILLSEVKFIWVVRAGIKGDGHANGLPAGFENKIQDKGLIIPWCDQIKVLSDPAIGGFLTHCGWNSTLESMWLGVPMICYPVNYDQPTNRKLVVDDWKIGVNMRDGTCPDRTEVAEKIRSVMSGSASKGIHQNMVVIRETMRKAVEIDGSSERNLEQFTMDLKARIDSLIKQAN